MSNKVTRLLKNPKVRCGVGAGLGVIGAVYIANAARVGDCPKVDLASLGQRYEEAVIISGGIVPKPNDFNDPAFDYTKSRINTAVDLYRANMFSSIRLTGTPQDVSLMSAHLDNQNVPYSLPPFNGTNTTEDMRAGFNGLRTDRVLVIAGEEQIHRAGLISEKYELDPEKDNGYVGVENTDMPNKFGLRREWIACVATRGGLEKYKEKIPFLGRIFSPTRWIAYLKT